MTTKARAVGLPLLAMLLLLLAASSASALITSFLPLEKLVDNSDTVFTARVESLDAEKGQLLLTVGDGIKGKAAFARMPVLLKGDAEAIKENQTPQLIDRLEKGQTLVVFAAKRDNAYLAFLYTNGTWVQLNGVKPEGVDDVRWSFGHFEPYLRRTFKGTTPDMVQAVKAGLETKKWPAIDKAEKPGLGPKVDKKPGASLHDRPRIHLATGPVLGVVVAPVLLAPLSLLALLFPSVFGGYTRWLAALTVGCTLLTLDGLYWQFGPALAGTIWGSKTLLWAAMTLCIVLGLAWSWARHHERVEQGDAPTVPAWVEGLVLGGLSLVGTAVIAYFAIAERQNLFDPDWLQALVMVAGCYGATGFVFWKRLVALFQGETPPLLLPTVGPLARPAAPTGAFSAFAASTARTGLTIPRRPAVATETVFLTTMAIAAVLLGVGLERRARASGGAVLETGAEGATHTVRAATVRGAPLRLPDGTISSSPLVEGNRVYIGTAVQDAFKPTGSVLCMDRTTGQVLWTAKTDKPVSISSPCVADGQLFIGEGYHQDLNCKLYCLDAATGARKWTFATNSHTESSPCVVDGKVYFGAGDDGVYCVDAQTGKEFWHFPGFHVDASPFVVHGRLYVGSGEGNVYQKTVVMCLDTKDGKPLWIHDVNLPAWGSPTVSRGLVYFGLGNGTFEKSETAAAGALLCLRADDKGEQVFRYDVPDGVLARPTVAGPFVYFGCRDGNVYAVERGSGKLWWKRGVESPVVTSPVVASGGPDGGNSAVYVLGSTGQVHCLDPVTGKDLYKPLDLTAGVEGIVDLWSSPALAVTEDAGGMSRQLFFGASLNQNNGLVYCLEDRVDIKAGAVNPLLAEQRFQYELRSARSALHTILEERFGKLSKELAKDIDTEDDLARLNDALRRAIHVKALSDFHL